MNLFSMSLNFPFILSSFLNLNCILPEWKENPLAIPQLSFSALAVLFVLFQQSCLFILKIYDQFIILMNLIFLSVFIIFYTYFN